VETMNEKSVHSIENVVEWMVKHKQAVMTAVGLVVLGLAAFFGYRSYSYRIQVSAHKSFMQSLKTYNAPVKKSMSEPTNKSLSFATEREKWEAVEGKFKQGYEAHSRSGIASMFLAYQSEALVNLDKFEESLVVLKRALELMVSPQVKAYYELKLSLMQLDSKNEQDVKAGLDRLEKISFEYKHLAHDQSLYYLGFYYWMNNNFNKAKSYWQQFIVKYGNEMELSDQVMQVKSRLDLIAI